MLYRDSLAIVAKGLPWEAEARLTAYYDSDIIGTEDLQVHFFSFSSPGDIIATYSRSDENCWAISGWAQKKLGQHQLNFGTAIQRRPIRQFIIGNSLAYMNEYRKLDQVDESQYQDQLLFIRNWGNVEAFGYDILGKKIDHSDLVNNGPRHPRQYSFFLEDQFASKKFAARSGAPLYAGQLSKSDSRLRKSH